MEGITVKIFGKEIKLFSSGKPGVKNSYIYNDYTNLRPIEFDGENTPYMLGNTINWKINYYQMRLRAWESYLKSDIIQNAIKKYCLWIVGAGLKLDSTPKYEVLQKLGIDFSEDHAKEFSKSAEGLFRLFAEQSESVYNKEQNMHQEAAEALKNAILAGDILCVKRYDGRRCSIETIDGKDVVSPLMSKYWDEAMKRGNKIVDGVEIDKKGGHVAYYVRQDDLTFKKIPAYGARSKMRQAWLMYGSKHKKNDVRGMSLLAAILETVSQLDDYKDATINSASENAKVVMTVEHDQHSTGETPLMDNIAVAFGKDKGTALEDYNSDCESKARKVAQSTKGQVFNLPIGAKLERHAGSSDINFKDFFGINSEIVFATIGIPPQVAMDKYNTSYSSSRTATKSWEYKMKSDRKSIMKWQFYSPIYELWLDVMILKNILQAPGYIGGDYMVKAAYRSCRFLGVNVPHIDPVKEASAERIKLGKAFDYIPITDVEQSMEQVGTGDYDQTTTKAKRQYENSDPFKEIDNERNSNFEIPNTDTNEEDD